MTRPAGNPRHLAEGPQGRHEARSQREDRASPLRDGEGAVYLDGLPAETSAP